LFNVVVYQAGAGVQYLSEVNVPGGDFEDYYGYQKLPIVTSLSSAAVFSVSSFQNFQSVGIIAGVPTTVFAAVRGSALGNSIVQLYPANHLASDMLNYTASVNGQCQLTLTAAGANIPATCAGTLAVLTRRFQLTRGSTCSSVQLYAIPYTPPAAPTSTSVAPLPTSTQTTSTPTQISSLELATPTPSAAPYCALPPYFTILVNETGAAPQYLYDPNSINDEALSFTNDPTQSLIFSLTSSGQLEFTVTNIWNQPVLLISEQDVQNAGNEAVFFTTATRFQSLGYLPVVATLDADCSISLNLPYDAASVLQVCLYLLLILLKNKIIECKYYSK